MSQEQDQAILAKNLVFAGKAAQWLERTSRRTEKIVISPRVTEDEFDELEVLASRFARLADILVQKLFRSIDILLLESTGSTVDVINRAEKRGLSNPNSLRRIREVRNRIAHEYADEDLILLFKEIKQLTPDLLDAYRRTLAFVAAQNLTA